MKALITASILLGLSSYANAKVTFKEANVALSYEELESEVFYNVEDVKLKDVKYIRSFDNKLYIPTSEKSEDITVKDLPFSSNIDTVILKPFSGVDGGGKIHIPNVNVYRAFGMAMGGEGGT